MYEYTVFGLLLTVVTIVLSALVLITQQRNHKEGSEKQEKRHAEEIELQRQNHTEAMELQRKNHEEIAQLQKMNHTELMSFQNEKPIPKVEIVNENSIRISNVGNKSMLDEMHSVYLITKRKKVRTINIYGPHKRNNIPTQTSFGNIRFLRSQEEDSATLLSSVNGIGVELTYPFGIVCTVWSKDMTPVAEGWLLRGKDDFVKCNIPCVYYDETEYAKYIFTKENLNAKKVDSKK